jgi:hypothetical protein
VVVPFLGTLEIRLEILKADLRTGSDGEVEHPVTSRARLATVLSIEIDGNTALSAGNRPRAPGQPLAIVKPSGPRTLEKVLHRSRLP